MGTLAAHCNYATVANYLNSGFLNVPPDTDKRPRLNPCSHTDDLPTAEG